MQKSIKSLIQTLLLLVLAFQAADLFAALPTVAAPTGGSTDNFLELILRYAKDAVLVISLIFGAVALIWVAWTALHKFWDAINGRGNWGELGVVAVVGGVLLVAVIFLLDKARGVIGTTIS